MTWWKFWKSSDVTQGAEEAVGSAAQSSWLTPERKAALEYEKMLIKEARLSDEASTSMGLNGKPVEDRPKVFDPALKHFTVGTVPEEPAFESAEQEEKWRRLRMAAMSHVLRTVADLPASEHLVLRGSALMCAWFQKVARPPKDLDFVVIPATRSMEDSRSVAMLDSIVKAVTSRECADIKFSADEVDRNHIWTYDRVPGTRIVFRWTAEGMPWGSTQLDFVFGESLPVDPMPLEIELGEGPSAKMLTASKSLSLAWKLLWLHSDMHPRGKDLYDAMLLAEATQLPYSLLEEVFRLAENGDHVPPPDGLVDFETDGLEWIGFDERDPQMVAKWVERLRNALQSRR